jgi:hypothetical protein
MEKYRVTLSVEERAALGQLVSKGKAAVRKLTHARVLLPADDSEGRECADEEIVAALGTSPGSVARVRKRLVTEGFQAALDHRPQPARPDKIKIRGDIEQRHVELACTDPPRGRCRWTLQLLADEVQDNLNTHDGARTNICSERGGDMRVRAGRRAGWTWRRSILVVAAFCAASAVAISAGADDAPGGPGDESDWAPAAKGKNARPAPCDFTRRG